MTALTWQPLVATQNISTLVKFFQWLIILLIFVFFLRVIRAVWVEVRPAGPRQTRSERRRQRRGEAAAATGPAAAEAKRRKRQLYLEVAEPPDQRGRVYDLDDELTVGRAPGCGVSTAYDVYSSTLHARIYRQRDQVWVEDLGSTNGTFVNSERITQPTRLGKGDLLQVGATVFEVDR